MTGEYAYMADSIYELGSALTIVVAVIFCFVAVIIALLNIFFYGSVSKSIKSVIESFNYTPEFLNLFFNVLPTFVLGVFLSYIYSRNKNIWFPIVIYGLYLLFSPLLIGYLGW